MASRALLALLALAGRQAVCFSLGGSARAVGLSRRSHAREGSLQPRCLRKVLLSEARRFISEDGLLLDDAFNSSAYDELRSAFPPQPEAPVKPAPLATNISVRMPANIELDTEEVKGKLVDSLALAVYVTGGVVSFAGKVVEFLDVEDGSSTKKANQTQSAERKVRQISSARAPAPPKAPKSRDASASSKPNSGGSSTAPQSLEADDDLVVLVAAAAILLAVTGFNPLF